MALFWRALFCCLGGGATCKRTMYEFGAEQDAEFNTKAHGVAAVVGPLGGRGVLVLARWVGWTTGCRTSCSDSSPAPPPPSSLSLTPAA